MPMTDYYNRFTPEKNWDAVMFRADRVLQSAEVNEMQSILDARRRGLGDALFKDGDVVKGCGLFVNPLSGEASVEAGLIYIAGAVRSVPEASFSISVTGTVTVGVFLNERVLTELDDASLHNPAIGSQGFGEAGAARRVVAAQWGFFGQEHAGEFYPVYNVDDGSLRVKETPPALDAVTQAIAAYDSDSAGGSYAVSGLTLTALPDAADGKQVYSLAEGRARVQGFGIELPQSRRIVYDAQPDLLYVETEPHQSTGPEAQRLVMERNPVKNYTRVAFTHEKTVSLTHGYAGAKDLLPDGSVVDILEVSQGNTTYVKGADYKLTQSQVDWSLTGSEPSPGSSYSVKYQYIKTMSLSDMDDSVEDGIGVSDLDEAGLTVSGAVAQTQVFISYNAMLPRIDRLILNRDGGHQWLQGMAAQWRPAAPQVPEGALPLASVFQTWTAARIVSNDAVRVVDMSDLNHIGGQLMSMNGAIAALQLSQDINGRESAMKKGYFVDPFLDDLQRDQGLQQSAAIVGGELTLPIDANVDTTPGDIGGPSSLPYTLVPFLEQLARSGSMKVNPYSAFDPLPAAVTLAPAVDRWTEVQTGWTSPITNRLIQGSGNRSSTSSSTTNQLVSETSQRLERLRQIEVRFELKGFGPNEKLESVKFDGITVNATA